MSQVQGSSARTDRTITWARAVISQRTDAVIQTTVTFTVSTAERKPISRYRRLPLRTVSTSSAWTEAWWSLAYNVNIRWHWHQYSPRPAKNMFITTETMVTVQAGTLQMYHQVLTRRTSRSSDPPRRQGCQSALDPDCTHYRLDPWHRHHQSASSLPWQPQQQPWAMTDYDKPQR